MKLLIKSFAILLVLFCSCKSSSISNQPSHEDELETFRRLHYLAKYDSVSEFSKLFKETRFNPNYQKDSITLLFTVVYENNIEVSKFLIKQGANVNFISKYGTVMHWALEYTNIEMGRLLLNNGYDPTIEKNLTNNKEPLCILAMFLLKHDKKEGEDFFKSLLNKGMNPTLKDKDGASTVLLSIYFESPRIVRLLQQHGLDLDARMTGRTNEVFVVNNYTPLMFACYLDKPEMVEELINLGVNLNLKSKDGKTALDIAQENNNERIIKLLTMANHG